MSQSKEQDLVNASTMMNRAMWAMNEDMSDTLNGEINEQRSTSFQTIPERDKYVYDNIGECIEELKAARKRYGAVGRRGREMGK